MNKNSNIIQAIDFCKHHIAIKSYAAGINYLYIEMVIVLFKT
jgi:hypothetical protein